MDQPPPTAREQKAIDESKSFWKSVGYAQFGGKYAAIDLQGKYLYSVTETPAGLKYVLTEGTPIYSNIMDPTGKISNLVGFSKPIPLAEAQKLKEDYLQWKKQYRASQEFWGDLGYPQYAGKYEPLSIPTGAKIKSVVEDAMGLQVTYETPSDKTVAYVSSYAEHAHRPFPLGYGSVESPFFYEHSLKEEYPELPKQQAENVKFWHDVGFSQYALKYEPFEVPSGYKVSKVKETSAGLEVTFEGAATKAVSSVPTLEQIRDPRWLLHRADPIYQAGQALRQQTILLTKQLTGEYSLTSALERAASTQYSTDPVTSMMQQLNVVPSRAKALEKIAGLVSTVESYYNPYAPNIVETFRKGPDFIFGRLAGEILTGLAIGEALKPVTTDISKGISKLWKGSRVESWLIEHSERYAGRAARGISYGIVDVPDVNVAKPVSYAGLEAEQAALSFGEVPHTALLDPLLATPEELPVSERLFVRPQLPYLPLLSTVTGESSFLPAIVGTALAISLDVRPRSRVTSQTEIGLATTARLEKATSPIITAEQRPERLTKATARSYVSMVPLFSVTGRSANAQISRSMSRLSSGQSVEQAQKTLQKQVSEQLQLTQTRALKTPRIQDPFAEPTKKGRKRRKTKFESILVGRYPRQYPVATPKYLLEKGLK
jgi:hypothetical protein